MTFYAYYGNVFRFQLSDSFFDVGFLPTTDDNVSTLFSETFSDCKADSREEKGRN